jgi:hypothetical protein
MSSYGTEPKENPDFIYVWVVHLVVSLVSKFFEKHPNCLINPLEVVFPQAKALWKTTFNVYLLI